MISNIKVLKNEDREIPVPELWRDTFKNIIDAFIDNDFKLEIKIEGVSPITVDNAKLISNNIEEYNCQLVSLPESTWNSSICLWMNGYWQVLVDLYTKEEGRSDLAMTVYVYEESSSFSFDIQSVHVP